MNILLVDDDQIIIKGLTNIIGRMAMPALNVMNASNAMDALEIMKYNVTDLLITDIDMPVMDGLSLIEEVKDKGYCTHYIILSGFDKFEFARKAIQYQVMDYLLKPIDKAELQRLIRQAYEKTHQQPLPSSTDSPLLISIPEPDPEKTPARLLEMLEYLKAHYQQNLSLDVLGRRFDLHPNYICHLFQTYLHTTFLKYLDALKLQKGLHLLLNDRNLSIQKIAVASGFLNERQFYKVFKKHTGMTPGAFRRTRVPASR